LIMSIALTHFEENIERIRLLHGVYAAVKHSTTPVLDVSDVLRAELVLVVSALDCYVHEVVRGGMLDVFQGNRPETEKFKQFDVSLNCVKQAFLGPDDFSWLEQEVIRRHSFRSFQQTEKVAEAIRLVSDIELWNEVAGRIGKSPDDIKRQLNLIIDRRNKIAHEADMNPSYPGLRWPITETDVDESIKFIGLVVKAMDDLLNVP